MPKLSSQPSRHGKIWHLSKYFFALADRPNDYFNTFFTRDIAPYQIYAKYDPVYLQFGFLHPKTDGCKQQYSQSQSRENGSHDAQRLICAASFPAH